METRTISHRAVHSSDPPGEPHAAEEEHNAAERRKRAGKSGGGWPEEHACRPRQGNGMGSERT